MVSGHMLGHVVFGKTNAVYVRESHSLTSLPHHKNSGKMGTRQDLVGPEWALKQVRGPFCGAGSVGAGVEHSAGLAAAVAAVAVAVAALRPQAARRGSSPQCCCSLPFVSSSTNPEEALLRGTGKRLPVAERAGCARLTQKLAHLLLQAHKRMAVLPLLDLAPS